MQLRTIYYCFWISYLMSCNRIAKDGVREFIPGVYERRINNEYSKGLDQLVIQPRQGNVYTIEKRSAITRIRGGKPLPVQYDTAVWTGIYDTKDKVIYEQQKGKVISFQPAANKLLVGASVYRKVKQ